MNILPWSWTALDSFETCGFRHLKVRIEKAFREEEGDQLKWGQKVHRAFEAALKQAPFGQLPEEMAPYQKYIERLRRGRGELLVEEKYALTKDLQPCDYYSPVAWFRSKNDIVRINGPIGIALDWKTGRRKYNPDNMQLMLAAQCLFSYHPELEYVQSKFIWLAEDIEDTEMFDRRKLATIWAENLLPRVEKMLHAAETMTFLPQPGGLCKEWCPVKVCQFHGASRAR